MKLFDMMTSEDIERIKEDSSYQTLLEMWREEKKKRQEAEGEVTIVKGIGQNSPEMKAAQAKIKELVEKCSEGGRAMIELNMKYEKLKEELARAKEDHQYDNLVHQKELESLRKNK
jgi:predicted RNase H-like nuclease (RuvC/YqgF family)